MHGIDLLDRRAWRDEYDLCLSLYSGAAECSYSSGNMGTVHDFVDEVLKHAISFEDTIRVRMINLNVFGASRNRKKAVSAGMVLLDQLGERFPSRPTMMHVFWGLFNIKRRLAGMSDHSILGLPVMHDQRKLAAM